jgi:hypothetical protein
MIHAKIATVLYLPPLENGKFRRVLESRRAALTDVLALVQSFCCKQRGLRLLKKNAVTPVVAVTYGMLTS